MTLGYVPGCAMNTAVDIQLTQKEKDLLTKKSAAEKRLPAVRRHAAGDRRCHRPGSDPDHSGASEATRAT